MYQEKTTSMNEPTTKSASHYVAIAHLFYAMAMADKAIGREEKLKVAAFLQKYWCKYSTSKEEEASIAKTVKDLIARNVEAQKAFLVFSEYFYKNRKLFDQNVKNQINTTCAAISEKKGKRSKMELIFTSKLYSFFNPPEDATPLSYHQDVD